MNLQPYTPGTRIAVDHSQYSSRWFGALKWRNKKKKLWPGTVVSVKSDLKGRETLVRHDNGKLVGYRVTPIVKIKK